VVLFFEAFGAAQNAVLREYMSAMAQRALERIFVDAGLRKMKKAQ